MTFKRRKVLLLVKTYPNLSRKYERTACMAGIDIDAKEWIRIYPVRFFDLPYEKRPHKFELIEVNAEHNPNEKFKRKESHKVKDDTIVRTGKYIPTEGDWKKRNTFLLPFLMPSIEALKTEYDKDHTSLGFIHPEFIDDFYAEPIEKARGWEKDLVEGKQKTLGGEPYKSPLDKIPYRFAYKFRCDATCPGHDMMVEDWELLELYRQMLKKYGTEETAIQKCVQKYKTEFLSKKDVYFFVGTESNWNEWLIIGVYYPPKPEKP